MGQAGGQRAEAGARSAKRGARKGVFERQGYVSFRRIMAAARRGNGRNRGGSSARYEFRPAEPPIDEVVTKGRHMGSQPADHRGVAADDNHKDAARGAVARVQRRVRRVGGTGVALAVWRVRGFDTCKASGGWRAAEPIVSQRAVAAAAAVNGLQHTRSKPRTPPRPFPCPCLAS